MLRSFRLGTAFGIGLYVHSTFLLVPFIVLAFTWGSDLQTMLIHQTVTLTVFVCVLLHELGHALMARQYGIGTRDITLYPIGGVARLERMSEDPVEEILIALAGPAVNVVIAILLSIGIPLAGVDLGAILAKPDRASPVDLYLLLLLASNVMLVLFNMLPIFPMDGGRVLRATLSAAFGHLRATEIASTFGMILAIVLCLPAMFAGFWLAPLVVFIAVLAGRQELMMVRAREAQRQAAYWRNQEPVEVLPADATAFNGYLSPPEPNFSGYTWDRHYRAWIEWRNGRAVHAHW